MTPPKRIQSRPFRGQQLPESANDVPVPTVALLEHLEEAFPEVTALEMLTKGGTTEGIALMVAARTGVESVIGYIRELIARDRGDL